MRCAILLLLFALLLGTGCGASAVEPDHPEAHSELHGGESPGHAHATPEDLRPLMHDLRGWMASLRTALDAGDIESAAGHARAIAAACDDQDVHGLDPELFGPRFAEIDRELHATATRLADLIETGDLDAAYEGYGSLQAACVSCHGQAPSAGRVDLSDLGPEDLGGPGD